MFSRRSEYDGETQEDDSEKEHLDLTRGSYQFLLCRGIEVEKKKKNL